MPHAEYQTDLAGYPYGALSALQGWFFEREIFTGVMQAFWGNGPWARLYLLLSWVVTGTGAYYLLRSVMGNTTAAIASSVLLLGNFYANHRFPTAISTAAIHWVVLSVLCDYRLLKDAIDLKRIEPFLLICRILLFALSLGHEVGYVAGIAFSSFVLTALVGVWHLGIRPAIGMIRIA